MTRLEALTALRNKVNAGYFDATNERAPKFNDFMGLCEIGLPQDARGLSAVSWRSFKGSLDAAKALHEAVLPDWNCEILKRGFRHTVHVYKQDMADIGQNTGVSNDPARAWILAILEALIQMETTQ